MSGFDENGNRIRISLPRWLTGACLTALLAILTALVRLIWMLAEHQAEIANLKRAVFGKE